MSFFARKLKISVSSAARVELIQRMGRTGGDPSNRAVLLSPDPDTPGNVEIWLVQSEAATSGVSGVIDDIQFVMSAEHEAALSGVRIDWQSVDAAQGQWIFNYNPSLRRVFTGEMATGLRDQGAEYALAAIGFACCAAFFGIAWLCGMPGDWFKCFGAALVVGGFAFAPIVLLAILRAPGSWLASLHTPVLILEGGIAPTRIDQLKDMMELPRRSPRVRLYSVPKLNHFSVLAPATGLLAYKLANDNGESVNLELSEAEVAAMSQPGYTPPKVERAPGRSANAAKLTPTSVDIRPAKAINPATNLSDPPLMPVIRPR